PHPPPLRFIFIPPATSPGYTLSLHDALPICGGGSAGRVAAGAIRIGNTVGAAVSNRRLLEPVEARIMIAVGLLLLGLAALFLFQDRKSTRLNSSHGSISYAVFCLKK